MREIGSEFWSFNKSKSKQNVFDSSIKFLLSGRTALDFIIRDIKKTRSFHKVYLPSYCCDSVIKPFVNNEICIEFYNVTPNDDCGFLYEIDNNKDVDAVLIINYFGYYDKQTAEIAMEFARRNVLVIEDITHSVLCSNKATYLSNYIFGSLRKWTALYSGGFVQKRFEEFNIDTPLDTNQKYVDLRKKAVAMKKKYMSDGVDNKTKYLECFNAAEKLLENDYKNYSIDNRSLSVIQELDIDYIRKKRIENANYLLKGIESLGFIKPIFTEATNNDCPLCVPVIVQNGLRDELRRYLIDMNIYCPVHWGLSKEHNIDSRSSNIYNEELSLVCDQRYSQVELDCFIDVIKKFWK